MPRCRGVSTAILFERTATVADNLFALILEARRLVAFSNRDFAELTGVSLRTVERYPTSGGISHVGQTDKLIVATHAKDPQLAARLAAAAGRDLQELGLPPAPVPVPPAPRAAPEPTVAAPAPLPAVPEARQEHADSVLLAAARALNLPPETVRPGVAAAFARASEMGVSVAGLAAQLKRPPADATEGKPPA
ncbi:MAG TPA: hypothetical protein VMB50_23760 [Myxococcales bacterium]|nr:hypothetical protein [Myxococcales bacterium]